MHLFGTKPSMSDRRQGKTSNSRGPKKQFRTIWISPDVYLYHVWKESEADSKHQCAAARARFDCCPTGFMSHSQHLSTPVTVGSDLKQLQSGLMLSQVLVPFGPEPAQLPA